MAKKPSTTDTSSSRKKYNNEMYMVLIKQNTGRQESAPDSLNGSCISMKTCEDMHHHGIPFISIAEPKQHADIWAELLLQGTVPFRDQRCIEATCGSL